MIIPALHAEEQPRGPVGSANQDEDPDPGWRRRQEQKTPSEGAAAFHPRGHRRDVPEATRVPSDVAKYFKVPPSLVSRLVKDAKEEPKKIAELKM